MATATLISAINVTGVPLEQQKIVLVGFGSAGIGITNLLAQFMQDRGVSQQEARKRFYGVDRNGLVTEKTTDLRPQQRVYARAEQEVQSWRQANGEVSLLDVIRLCLAISRTTCSVKIPPWPARSRIRPTAQPSVLIGV